MIRSSTFRAQAERPWPSGRSRVRRFRSAAIGVGSRSWVRWDSRGTTIQRPLTPSSTRTANELRFAGLPTIMLPLRARSATQDCRFRAHTGSRRAYERRRAVPKTHGAKGKRGDTPMSVPGSDRYAGGELDGFLIGERIHSGAMGYIYRVDGRDSAFPMIMKVPRIGPGESGEGLIGYETEAMVLPALSGPHVPRFVAMGNLAKTPYLVTEWVDGESLEQVIKRGPLPTYRRSRFSAPARIRAATFSRWGRCSMK